MNENRDVFIVSAVRLPIGVGKPSGALFPFLPVDLTARVLVEVVRRAGLTRRGWKTSSGAWSRRSVTRARTWHACRC